MNLGSYCTAKKHGYNLIFHALFKAWVARSSPNSDWGCAQKTLGTADLAILA